MSDNQVQIQFWSGNGGARWLAADATMETSIAQFGDAALHAAAPRTGERALDVGCGAGGTTLALARLIAPGQAVGLDVSPLLLAAARKKAEAVPNVSFLEADATFHPFQPEFDLIYSRLGVMFFADPFAAFANLRRALKPGGRLAFVCWRTLKENDWTYVPYTAAIKQLPPIVPPPPGAPGPNSFGDKERVRSILSHGGFADIAIEAFDAPMKLGDTLDAAMDVVALIGASSRAVEAAAPELRAPALAAARAALAPLAAKGPVALKGAAWIVTARAP